MPDLVAVPDGGDIGMPTATKKDMAIAAGLAFDAHFSLINRPAVVPNTFIDAGLISF